jgi:hypothetical protein
VRTAAVAVLSGLALAACGSSQEIAVEDAARGFAEALASDDLERACTSLAPSTVVELETSTGQACARALQAQDVVVPAEVGRVQRFGRQASVAVRSSEGETDTWFLSRFDGRWLLVAAACSPRPELPYDCDVEGP